MPQGPRCYAFSRRFESITHLRCCGLPGVTDNVLGESGRNGEQGAGHRRISWGSATWGKATVTVPRKPTMPLGYPYGYLPPPMRQPAQAGLGRRVMLIFVLAVTMVVVLGGAAAAGLLISAGLGSPAVSVSAATTAATTAAAASAAAQDNYEPQVPSHPAGTATLADPVITTAKVPYGAADEWCSLLTAADIHAVTGFDQQGAPDSRLLCTHYFVTDAGYLFISDIPAIAGAAYTVRGNSAILYQRGPTSCEVSVALNRSGGVLDIDVRGVRSPRLPLCAAAVELAGRAFDRLPPA